MSKSSHLILTIITRGRVMAVNDNPIPNVPQAIATIGAACCAMHSATRRTVHFQLRDPATGQAVLVMEHGATTFHPMGGR